jgi:hypothetical protein
VVPTDDYKKCYECECQKLGIEGSQVKTEGGDAEVVRGDVTDEPLDDRSSSHPVHVRDGGPLHCLPHGVDVDSAM